MLVLGDLAEQWTLGPERIYVSADEQEVCPPSVHPTNMQRRWGRKGKCSSHPLTHDEGQLDFLRLTWHSPC